MKLPPANTIPLDRVARARVLSYGQLRLLDSVVGEREVFHVQRTRTKVDVGAWLCRGRVCICLSSDEAVLFANGRRPYVAKIPLERLHESRYNHVTGEVTLPLDSAPQVRGLRMPPLEGLDLLAQIHRGDAPVLATIVGGHSYGRVS